MNRKTDQKGFTIVELMIASTVFTFILLLCTYGLIYIGRVYYKSVTTARTQEVARTIMDDVAQAIQFSGSNPVTLTPSSDINGICIDSRRYSFRLGIKQDDLAYRRVLVSDSNVDCGAGTQPVDITSGAAVGATTDPREFLAGNMRLTQFEVTTVNAAAGLYSVRVKVVAGDYDLLTPTPSGPTIPAGADAQCKNDLRGGQFCAVAHLSTVVQKRLN